MSYWDVLNKELGRLNDAKIAAEIRVLLELLDGHGILEAVDSSDLANMRDLVEQCRCLNGHLGDVEVSVGMQLGEDPSGEVFRRLLRDLDRSNGDRTKGVMLNHRLLGSLSHEVGMALLSHQPLYRKPKRPLIDHPELPYDRFEKAIAFKNGRLRKSVQHRVERAVAKGHCSKKKLFGMPKQAETTLRMVVGSPPVDRLLSRQVDQTLRELTWRSWLQLAQFTAGQAAPLFVSELLIFRNTQNSKEYRLSGGRIDVLMLVDPQGQPLTGRLRARAVEALAKRPKYLTTLIRLLPELGETIFLKLIDFKFQVGDGLGATETIKPSQIANGPLAKHRKQVARYLGITEIAYRKARGLRRTPWGLQLIQTGEIWYVFADRPPVVHVVELSGAERQELMDTIRANSDAFVALAELLSLGQKAVRGAIQSTRRRKKTEGSLL